MERVVPDREPDLSVHRVTDSSIPKPKISRPVITWQDLPDSGDRFGWPWRPDQNSVEGAEGAWDGFPSDSCSDSRSDRPDAPPVLVVTPSFNQGVFLEQTIRSVLLQGYPHLTYHVVDGGSTDESHAVIERYRPWIDHVVIEPDDGQSDAIGKGIGDRRDGWFNWINSDDWLAPGTLWQLAAAHRDRDLVAMNIEVIGDGAANYVIKNAGLDAKRILLDGDYSFAQPGLWFRLDHLHACGGIDRGLNYGFDWDLVIRYLATASKVGYLDRIGAYFRVHEQSKTAVESQKSQEANQFEREHQLIRDKLESSLPDSFSQASRLGRRRRRWNQTLVETLDRRGDSAIALATKLAAGVCGDPRARLTPRTLMSIARLLSRYVRPRGSIDRAR